jgi:hypothetical protein
MNQAFDKGINRIQRVTSSIVPQIDLDQLTFIRIASRAVYNASTRLNVYVYLRERNSPENTHDLSFSAPPATLASNQRLR